jgi:hypothetical protein
MFQNLIFTNLRTCTNPMRLKKKNLRCLNVHQCQKINKTSVGLMIFLTDHVACSDFSDKVSVFSGVMVSTTYRLFKKGFYLNSLCLIPFFNNQIGSPKKRNILMNVVSVGKKRTNGKRFSNSTRRLCFFHVPVTSGTDYSNNQKTSQ